MYISRQEKIYLFLLMVRRNVSISLHVWLVCNRARDTISRFVSIVVAWKKWVREKTGSARETREGRGSAFIIQCIHFESDDVTNQFDDILRRNASWKDCIILLSRGPWKSFPFARSCLPRAPRYFRAPTTQATAVDCTYVSANNHLSRLSRSEHWREERWPSLN